jgi:hypothetical protein
MSDFGVRLKVHTGCDRLYVSFDGKPRIASQFVWEQHYGSPAGGRIYHRDGDRSNVDISNLTLDSQDYVTGPMKQAVARMVEVPCVVVNDRVVERHSGKVVYRGCARMVGLGLIEVRSGHVHVRDRH